MDDGCESERATIGRKKKNEADNNGHTRNFLMGEGKQIAGVKYPHFAQESVEGESSSKQCVYLSLREGIQGQ